MDARLPTFSAPSLTPLLWALAVGDLRPPAPLLERLMRHTAGELKQVPGAQAAAKAAVSKSTRRKATPAHANAA